MSLEGWKQIFEIGGVILLFLTFVFGAGALYTASKLNALQSEQLRQFDKDLTGAKTDLGKQQVLAADAVARVVGLEHDAADAKAEMAKQQARAATAEQSLLELQERVKIRHLSAEQRKKLIEFLKAPAIAAIPKGPISVARLLWDESAQPFASQLKEALESAGWQSGEIGRDLLNRDSTIPIGVVLIFQSAKAIPPHAGAIQRALIAAGLEPTLGENPNIPEGMVEILIGVKP